MLPDFPKFTEIIEQYQKTIDVSERQELLPRVEESFKQDYAVFAAKCRDSKRTIVLFFDTYEYTQGTEMIVEDQRQEELTGFSQWIETRLFPTIADNTLLIVVGRYPLREVKDSMLTLREIMLPHFTLSETIEFWKKCFNCTTDRELAEKIGSRELIEIFHTLADGRPVLLSLFVDWVNSQRNLRSPIELLNSIENETSKITKSVTLEQKQFFEKALILSVVSLVLPEDRAIVLLAVLHHGMTPAMYSFMAKVPIQESRGIFQERLKPLSFIKYRKGNVILLNGEMRRLMVQYWWETLDTAHHLRKEIMKDILQYYNEQLLSDNDLSEPSQQAYTSELLDYAFIAEPLDGLELFCSKFDTALEQGKYDYCDLLLREAETYYSYHPYDMPFPYFLDISRRRLQYSIEVDGNYTNALKIANNILEKYTGQPGWQNMSIRGHILLLKGTVELLSEMFEAAIDTFIEAKQVFYRAGEDFWLYQVNNQIGGAFFRQGKFNEAIQWLTKGYKGFFTLLEPKVIPQQERLRLIKGIQLSFRNLAMIHSLTGQFEKATRYAEIALDIIQNLPQNKLELAKAYNTVGHVFVASGHTIDARHYITESEKLLHEVNVRLIEGRTKTDLGSLHYRVNELAYLLEYYRAEEIEGIIHQDVRREQDVQSAENLLRDAINLLEEKPAVEKELADAYYALGELYMVTSSQNHWEKAEEAFMKNLRWGKKSRFQHQVVDTLESLITLYYFWNGSSEISTEMLEINHAKIQEYQSEFEKSNPTIYPELVGKYEIILGDIEFDRALNLLRSNHAEYLEHAVRELTEAFKHYISAAKWMEKFREDHYYLVLGVFYNRLKLLIDEMKIDKISSELLEPLNELRWRWEGISEEFAEIYRYAFLRDKPEGKLEDIKDLEKNIQNILTKGNFGWALLLNDCLIQAYRVLFNHTKDYTYFENLIRRLTAQVNFYRERGDEYQSTRHIKLIRKEISSIKELLAKKPESISSFHSLGSIPGYTREDVLLNLIEGLDGYTDSAEGTLLYRRGEYGRLLEFYLQDELSMARTKFDHQFPGAREEALCLLKEGEQKLKKAISFTQEVLQQCDGSDDRKQLHELLFESHKNLGETLFRLGELLTLNEQFTDYDGQMGALSYLEEASKAAEYSGDDYRYDDAVQSYANALYFSGNYEHPDYHEKRLTLEKQLEQKFQPSGRKITKSILARFCITRGDAHFNAIFQRNGENKYTSHPHSININILREMLRYYIEACNYMAQHSSTNFAAIVRVLQRRIQLIADIEPLQIIQRVFEDVWSDQEYLKDKTDELEILLQYIKMRGTILENETTDE